MKERSSVMLAFVALAALALPAVAQHSDLSRVNVPFNFVAENQRLQAGDYSIQLMQNGRLLIRSADGKVATTVLSLPAPLQTTATASEVVFNRYGGEYFLSEVRLQGQNTGREVLRGKKESELARKGIPRALASLAAR
jgi:hypothetical protein